LDRTKLNQYKNHKGWVRIPVEMSFFAMISLQFFGKKDIIEILCLRVSKSLNLIHVN